MICSFEPATFEACVLNATKEVTLTLAEYKAQQAARTAADELESTRELTKDAKFQNVLAKDSLVKDTEFNSKSKKQQKKKTGKETFDAGFYHKNEDRDDGRRNNRRGGNRGNRNNKNNKGPRAPNMEDSGHFPEL
eukprot:Pgem_evm1s11928